MCPKSSQYLKKWMVTYMLAASRKKNRSQLKLARKEKQKRWKERQKIRWHNIQRLTCGERTRVYRGMNKETMNNRPAIG